MSLKPRRRSGAESTVNTQPPGTRDGVVSRGVPFGTRIARFLPDIPKNKAMFLPKKVRLENLQKRQELRDDTIAKSSEAVTGHAFRKVGIVLKGSTEKYEGLTSRQTRAVENELKKYDLEMPSFSFVERGDFDEVLQGQNDLASRLTSRQRKELLEQFHEAAGQAYVDQQQAKGRTTALPAAAVLFQLAQQTIAAFEAAMPRRTAAEATAHLLAVVEKISLTFEFADRRTEKFDIEELLVELTTKVRAGAKVDDSQILGELYLHTHNHEYEALEVALADYSRAHNHRQGGSRFDQSV